MPTTAVGTCTSDDYCPQMLLYRYKLYTYVCTSNHHNFFAINLYLLYVKLLIRNLLGNYKTCVYGSFVTS